MFDGDDTLWGTQELYDHAKSQRLLAVRGPSWIPATTSVRLRCCGDFLRRLTEPGSRSGARVENGQLVERKPHGTHPGLTGRDPRAENIIQVFLTDRT